MADAFRLHGPDFWSTSDGKALIDDTWKIVSKYNGRFVHSHEGLSLPYFFNPPKQPRFIGVNSDQFPFTVHLKSFCASSLGKGKVTVIMTLRNQAEFLASLYAQQANTIMGSGQQNFSDSVNSLLSDRSTKGSGFLEYDKLFDSLCDAVGSENVHFLFLEELNTDEYWIALRRVTGYDRGNFSIRDISTERENVRSLAGGTWKLRQAAEDGRKEILSRPSSHSSTSCLCKELLEDKQGSCCTICLTSELIEKIQERFSASNQRLSKLLGRSLPSQMWS